jgi:hypothetical protein
LTLPCGGAPVYFVRLSILSAWLFGKIMITKRKAKGEFVFRTGDKSVSVCLLLSGETGLDFPTGERSANRKLSFHQKVKRNSARAIICGESGLARAARFYTRWPRRWQPTAFSLISGNVVFKSPAI